MTINSDKWLDEIAKDHGVPVGRPIGVEIVGRVLILDGGDYAAIDEILEQIREIGSAEITKQITL